MKRFFIAIGMIALTSMIMACGATTSQTENATTSVTDIKDERSTAASDVSTQEELASNEENQSDEASTIKAPVHLSIAERKLVGTYVGLSNNSFTLLDDKTVETFFAYNGSVVHDGTWEASDGTLVIEYDDISYMKADVSDSSGVYVVDSSDSFVGSDVYIQVTTDSEELSPDDYLTLREDYLGLEKTKQDANNYNSGKTDTYNLDYFELQVPSVYENASIQNGPDYTLITSGIRHEAGMMVYQLADFDLDESDDSKLYAIWSTHKATFHDNTEHWMYVSDYDLHPDYDLPDNMEAVFFRCESLSGEDDLTVYFCALSNTVRKTSYLVMLTVFNDSAQYDYKNEFDQILHTVMVTDTREYRVNAGTNKKIEKAIKADKPNLASKKIANNKETRSVAPSDDFRATMDSYVEFFRKYADLMKQYKENPNDLQVLSAYADVIAQYNETMSKLEAIDQNALSKEDQQYYIDAMAEIQKMLIEIQ